MIEASLYPITQLLFECCGCGMRWSIVVDPPIKSIAEFHAFTKDPNRMESCPKACGAKTCNIAFRVKTNQPNTDAAETDPFAVFDKKK